MSTLTNVTEATFAQEVLESPIPVVVDFWAVWCGPCRSIAPILEEIAQENSGLIKIVKLDVDANPSLAAKYQIRSIPTLKVFSSGAEVQEIQGALPKAALLTELSVYLTNK